VSPASAEQKPPSRVKKPRLGFYIPLTEDGVLDGDRVSDTAALEKIRKALAVPLPAEQPKLHLNPQFVPYAYSLLELAIQWGGGLFLKWPLELRQEMYFEAKDKENLVAPTVACLEEHCPPWLLSNQGTAALAIALSQAVNNMVLNGTARYVEKKKLELQSPPAKPNGHATPPEPVSP